MQRLSSVLSLLFSFLMVVPASAETRLNVVTSFSILADFARQVGGDKVSVASLVGPDSDVHVYTPTPHDAKDVGAARLLIVNGLGLEGWLPRLQQASGSKAPIVVATQGITARKRGSDADPHAWQSVGNAMVYVRNIRDALIAADPADADIFKANAERYLAELTALDREVRAEIEKIPPERRKVISTHDAFGYFADAYGIAFIAPLGVSTETEPSARDVAEIIGQVRKAKIPAVFLENFNDDRLVGRIAAETGAKIGGTLYSDALSEEKGPVPTYIAMVRHNIRALTSALVRQGF
ncbi:metal ABC transporter substrate-binding protein [Bradyrhizobium ontarionense]|uniref:Metal ABC transporter substrate-binding protein n=1 Tax=Bradyrhizobium ontarionense TaxID=2898149 RepID=A0ABY3RMD4_9BRAD|nr:metal ABC transporter substrate-binding protein [Bradyrhizobium sp. A19]UFZ08559.1 metal ABC transporter substrate-binding protein [Bradyrhizobium sp. A19]